MLSHLIPNSIVLSRCSGITISCFHLLSFTRTSGGQVKLLIFYTGASFIANVVYSSWSNMHSLVWEMTWVLRDACASGPSLPEDAHVLSKAVKKKKRRE